MQEHVASSGGSAERYPDGPTYRATPKPVPRARNDVVRRLYRVRGALVAPPVLAAAAHARSSAVRPASAAIGGALFLVGWAIRVWAQRHLGYRVATRMRLTTCGPFRYVRHPIYLANTAIVAGAVLITGAYWLTAAATFLCCGVYGFAARYEEAALSYWYGVRYRRYASVTSRWIPRYVCGADGSCDRVFSWRQVARAECQVPLVLVPVLIALVVR